MNKHVSRISEIVPAQNLSALLALDYEDFVECAYLTIFNRSADSDGLAHSVERLRAGHPKLAILSTLYRSEEARSAKVQIPWLRMALFRYQFTKMPVINHLFHRVNQNAIRLQLERRLHVLEQTVGTLVVQNAARATEIEQLSRGVSIPAEVAGTNRIDVARELSDKSVIAKRVYNALKDAIYEQGEASSRVD